MYRRVDDFLTSWGECRAGTLRILEQLTDESLGRAVAAGHRTLGGLAWHLAASVAEMANRTGLELGSLDPEAPPPDAAAAIREAYAAVSQELADRLRERWTDADLERTDDMYGQQWPRGLTLAILERHEIHHRGQMTVLMRQAGLKVPGIFGPALEEWGAHGMEPPAY